MAPENQARTPGAITVMETAILGGGCFWCVEAVFDKLQGVERAVSGYMGGTAADANYEAVCSKATDHVEVVRVTFDPAVVSYADVLRIFFTVHDPTTLNRQGNDVGPQYRSVIFYGSPAQEATAREVVAEVAGLFDDPVVTALEPAATFYPAEEYHQGYYDRVGARNSYCTFVISPKVNKFRERFADRLKAEAA